MQNLMLENCFSFQLVHTLNNKTNSSYSWSLTICQVWAKPSHFRLLTFWKKLTIATLSKDGGKDLGLNMFGRFSPLLSFAVYKSINKCSFPINNLKYLFQCLKLCIICMLPYSQCLILGHTPARWNNAGSVRALLQWLASSERFQQNTESWRLL